MIMEDRRVREKIGSKDFYTGSLKPKLHLVCLGNPNLTLHYFKRFTKFTLLQFQNKQNTHTHTHKTLESHKNHRSIARNLLQTWKTTSHTQSLRKIKAQW